MGKYIDNGQRVLTLSFKFISISYFYQNVRHYSHKGWDRKSNKCFFLCRRLSILIDKKKIKFCCLIVILFRTYIGHCTNTRAELLWRTYRQSAERVRALHKRLTTLANTSSTPDRSLPQGGPTLYVYLQPSIAVYCAYECIVHTITHCRPCRLFPRSVFRVDPRSNS